MKKLIGTVAVAALLASAAFAELNFSAWLKNLAGVVASDGDDINAGITNPWGGQRNVRFGISYESDDEKVGMVMGIAVENGSITNFSSNYMWVKPWDWLRVSAGNYADGDTGLRSDLCFGSWNWLRPNNAIRWGEGITFSDIDGAGLRLQLFPVDGLQIAALIPYSWDYTAAEDVYRNMKIGAGYTIGDIGTLKVQWHGKSADKNAAGYYYKDKFIGADAEDVNGYFFPEDEDSPSAWVGSDGKPAAPDFTKISYKSDPSGGVENLFEVAFDLVAVDNMFLTVGGAFDIKEESDSNVYTVALGWSYKLTDTFALFLDGSVAIPGNSDLDPLFGAALGINVGLTDSLGLDAEVRWLHQGEDADSVSFLVGLNYSVSSNGGLGLGFQGLIAGKNASVESVFPSQADKFSWAVPIYCTINF